MRHQWFAMWLSFPLAFVISIAPSPSLAQTTRPLASTTTNPSSTQPTTRELQTGRFEASWPLPEDYQKSAGPVGKKYGLPALGKSFQDLRSVSVGPDGHTHPARPNDPILQLDPTLAYYTVYVPDSYKPDTDAYGLIVWESPGGSGLRGDWTPVLDEQHLIFIAPHDVGNGKYPVWRTFMAVESVRQAKLHYNIDPDRVYVSGMSGGGRISSHVIAFFPDVFSGAFCMCGVNHYRDVPVDATHVYPGFWPSPDLRLVNKAKADSRIVMLTGTNDMNHQNTIDVRDVMTKDGYKHITFLDVPGMGHAMPDAEWFKKGIVALDQPLFDGAGDTFNRAMQLEKQRKLGDAMLAFESVARHASDKPFGAEAKQHATALRNRYNDQVEKVRAKIADKSAKDASAALQQLRADFGPPIQDTLDALAAEIRLLSATRSAP